VKNDIVWKKINKICNFEIFIINLQFSNISGKKKFWGYLTRFQN